MLRALRAGRGAALALAACGALALLAYAAWPWWAPVLGRALLAEHGIELREARLRRPLWRQLRIDRLALDYRADAVAARIEIDDAQLHYRWRDLLRGRIAGLDMAALRVALTPGPGGGAAGAPLEARQLLPAALLARVPVDTLRIARLDVVTPLAPPYAQLEGDAQLAGGELTVHLRNSAALDIALRADTRNRLQLRAQWAGRELGHLSNDVEADVWRGDIGLDLDALAALLRDRRWLEEAFDVSGALRGTWRGQLPERIDAQALRNLTLAGDFSLQAGLRAPAPNMNAQARLAGQFRLAQQALEVRWRQARITGAAAPPAAFARQLALAPVSMLPFALSADGAAPLRISLDSARAQWPDGAIDIRIGDDRRGAALNLAGLDVRYDDDWDGWRARTQWRARMAWPKLQQGSYGARGLSAELAGVFDGAPQAGTLELAQGAVVRAKTVSADGIAAGAVAVRSAAPSTWSWRGARLALPRLALTLERAEIRRGEQRYRIAGASASAADVGVDLRRPLQAQAALRARIDALAGAVGALRFNPVDVDATLNLAGAALAGDWRARDRAGVATVTGTLRHDLRAGRGELRARLAPLQFQENGNYLPALFDDWPYPFDFSAGRVAADAHLRWRGRDLDADFSLGLADLGGFYNLNLFSGLNLDLRGRYGAGRLQLQPATLRLDRIDVGFPITGARVDIAADAEALRLRDLSVQLLGGTLSQAEITYRWAQAQHDFTLRFDGIDVAPVLALEQGVEGSGILDGELPIALGAGGVSVRDGAFRARAPGGVIRYSGAVPAGLAANPAMQLALEQLRNFHYDVLNLRADYAQSGDLRLQMQLQGRNPDLGETRPIHFNLDVRENIPQLLRSIQLSRDIGDRIERRVQDFYERQQRESPR